MHAVHENSFLIGNTKNWQQLHCYNLEDVRYTLILQVVSLCVDNIQISSDLLQS